MYISLAMAHVNLSPGRFMLVVQKEKDRRQQKAHAGYLQFYLFNHSTWDKLNCWGNWEIDKTSRELTSISEITEDVSPLWQGTRGRWDSHWDAKSTEHGWTALGILYCHVEVLGVSCEPADRSGVLQLSGLSLTGYCCVRKTKVCCHGITSSITR